MGAARESTLHDAGHEQADIHDEVAKRVAAWWWGHPDEDIASHLSTATMIAHERINCAIYMARIAEDTSKYRALKEWAYMAALEFVCAKGSGQRKRSMVESFRPDWGHQAARDGLAMVLWPHRLNEIPGINARGRQFGCGDQAYRRVRDEVQGRALEGFVNFMFDMSCLTEGRWTRDMIRRWELATGADWGSAA